MKTVVTLTALSFVLILALSMAAYADYTRVGSIPARFPEEPYGYAVTGLETKGETLFMTVAVDSNSAIYLIDPTDGGVINSYFWQLAMPEGLGAPSLSGAAFEPPSHYWVCDAYSGYHLNLTWTGGDTITIYYSWKKDRIPNPNGLEFEEYATLWTVDGGETDSLYESESYGIVMNAYPVDNEGWASAVTEMPDVPGLQGTGNLLICYDTVSDGVFEYTKAGEFVQAHSLNGSPFDGGITAATFYDGKLYLGGHDDSIYIFQPVEYYEEPVPAGDGIVVDVIPDELRVGFTHVGSAGDLYVEKSPTQPCPPPAGVAFFSDFYDVSTTASFDYLTKVALLVEGEFPAGVNEKAVRAFVRASGECGPWRDVTVETIDIEEGTRTPILANLKGRLSEDDEFSVFALGEDTRRVSDVVALKFDYLDSVITRNSGAIPQDEYEAMTGLLSAARTAAAGLRYGLAARQVDQIAEIAMNTPGIPHTYDPLQGQEINVAGRIMSRAHTLSFSLRLMVQEQRLGNPPGPSWKDPAINIFGGGFDRLIAGPNPSHSEFIISFAASGKHPVSVKVYSVDGRLVRTLIDGDAFAGSNSVRWDGRSDQGVPVAPGTYFAVLEDGGRRAVRKMVLQR